MKKKYGSISSEATANIIGSGFLHAAKYFREIQDTKPEQLASIAKLAGFDRRTAYYLAQIDRTFQDLSIDEGRLTEVGWTKLQIIASRINAANCDELLTMAEFSTVRELTTIMRNQQPVKGTRVVLLYLEPGQYQMFSKAVLKHGGKKSGCGLVDKEVALTAALMKVTE